MNKEVRPHAPHRLVNLQTAEFGVDAPTLSAHVAAPDKAQVSFRIRRREETARRQSAENLRVVEGLKSDAVENLLSGGQVGEVDAGGEVGRFDSRRANDAPRVLKRFRRRIFDDHSRGPVAAAPDYRAIGCYVAALRAEGDLWADFVGNDDPGGVGAQRSRPQRR